MGERAPEPLRVGAPARLASENYFSPRASLRIDHQIVHEPVAVHWHEFYEVHLILAGEGIHVLNGRAYPLERGSFFLLTPADFHALAPRAGMPLDLFNVIFSDDALTDEVQQLLFGELSQYRATLVGTALDGMESEVRRLYREAQEQRTGYRLLMRGSLERILIDAVRYTSTRDSLGDLRQGDPQRKIRRALTYLHHHFRDPVTLAEVACQAHLSPHYFSSCFHEATGASFQRYLCDLRLRFARSLLAVSSASVTDLCLASGFSTLSNFERAFKTCYGCSPRVFRARIELDSWGQTNQCGKSGGAPAHAAVTSAALRRVSDARQRQCLSEHGAHGAAHALPFGHFD